MPSMKSGLALLFAAAAVASPNPLVDRNGGVNCAALNTIVTILHEQAVCTPFCSSYLHISTVTSTQTSTSTPSPVTTTTTVSSTDTVTTTTFSTSSGVTTVYPVVAVSTTSTCALGATVVQSSSSNVNVKRETPCTTSAPPPPPSSIPIGTPLALTGFVQTDVSSACSCLNIPTPTKIVTTTTTLTTNTITKTIASTAYTTVTVTSTTTTWTSTYSGTQYYTSTFTILPPPSSTQNPPANPTETFGIYPHLDFSGKDIQNFFCNNRSTPPAPFTGTTCQNFNDCVNECAYYNANQLGGNTTCGAVVYNAPPNDNTQGSCYLKTGETGCGGPNNMVMTGVLLPLIATDPQ